MTPEQNRRLAEEMGVRDDGYWWCSLCLAEKSPQQVTYEENCTTCGRPVEWTDAPDFTSDSGFVLALAYAQDDTRHEWKWAQFEFGARWKWLHDHDMHVDYATFARYLFTPANFAPVLLAFIEQGKEGGK